MMTALSPAEMTLDELRTVLVPHIAANAAFDGWTDRALAEAAIAIGIPPERAKLVFPHGATDMIDAWFETIDRRVEEHHSRSGLAVLKIRERIEALILTRLEIVEPQREAVRRALAILAFPANLARGTQLGWRTADSMWRLAGDEATDFNHYTKRATLAAIYGATLIVWLNDNSENHAETKAFLKRRIDGVMKFEKTKALLKPDPDRHFSLARFAGRLRYPDR